MKSIGLPSDAYKVAWAVVAVWLAKATAGHLLGTLVWQPAGHPSVMWIPIYGQAKGPTT